MLFKSLLAAAAAPLALAHPAAEDSKINRCGFPTMSPAQEEMVAKIAANDGKYAPGARTASLTVPIHLHAAVPSDAKPGYLSKEKLRKQFDVMVESYGPYGINFELKNITRTVDDKLADFSYTPGPDGGVGGSTPALEKYWKETRTGGYEELHLYFYASMSGGLLGICTFPDILAPIEGPPYFLDACHNHGDSIPDGPLVPYDMGITAVHEAGHWFGLFHTFQGSAKLQGCNSDGDVVADTAPQRTPTYGCPADNTKDTCPKKPGFDNIHNYMDYSDDVCLTEFTEGQEMRMHNMYNTLRKGL